MADIVRFASDTGGRKAISRGLFRLEDALPRQDKLLIERAKAVAESSLAAWLAVIILSVGPVIDASAARVIFAASPAGRIDMTLGLGVVVFLVFMVQRLIGCFKA